MDRNDERYARDMDAWLTEHAISFVNAKFAEREATIRIKLNRIQAKCRMDYLNEQLRVYNAWRVKSGLAPIVKKELLKKAHNVAQQVVL